MVSADMKQIYTFLFVNMRAGDCYYHLMESRGRFMPTSRAGFVLAGGRSSRMGQDKALLPWKGSTLIESVAREVFDAVGNVTLIGSPERYGDLGFPVISDKIAGCGPLGGLHAALSATTAEWNLLVACDMPGVTRQLLEGLLEAAEASGADALVPQTPGGLEPLCAVYNVRLLPACRICDSLQAPQNA